VARVVSESGATSAYVPEWGEERERYDAGDNPDPVWAEITPMSGDEMVQHRLGKAGKSDSPKAQQRTMASVLEKHAALHGVAWSDGRPVKAHELWHVPGYSTLGAELFLAVITASTLSEGTRRGLMSQSGCSQPQDAGTKAPSTSSGGAAPDAGGQK
jgi:hypothetical protein